ncbi:MAG: DUF3347 domain-containing protein [Chitinophagaceae bacterium]
MKKIVLLIALFAISFTKNSYAQDSTQQYQLSQLLSRYYGVKEALISGNPASASLKAEEFVKALNGIDHSIIPQESANSLLKDGQAISETKDIKRQREYFANFSNNIFALAKAVKLTSGPIHHQYCPMKKAYWLSSEKAIKNPYYGSAMLTCGKVVETIIK